MRVPLPSSLVAVNLPPAPWTICRHWYSPMPNPRGLDVRVLPSAEEGAKHVGRLKEIMAV